MEVTTSGPAVLDSVVVFTARVFVEPNDTIPEEKFDFLWLNTVDHSENHTHGSYVSQLHRAFGEEAFGSGPGDFLMAVVVSLADQPRNILCFSTTVFKLTKRLNGNLQVKQSLPYRRSNNTFVVDQPIHFYLNITDRFPRRDSPKYTYFWYNGSQLIQETDQPHYQLKLSQPNVLHLQAVAMAQFSSAVRSVLATSTITPNDSTIEDKVGSFTEKLHFKASLSNCNMSRRDSSTQDQSLKLGNPLVLNITCMGSFPSAVCWNVTRQNSTLNNTCKPGGQFANTTQHNVTVTIGNTGWNTVHLAVYNDISFQVLSQNYYVYDPDSVDIPVLVFPMVFLVLGGVIAVVGGTYIVRLRRQAHVEVADFDFDPTISVRSSGSFSSLRLAVKQLFQRARGCTRSTPDDRYSVNPSRHMYDTL
ncbi:hypothetical protein ACOMHN_000197 [Nucella lapillus]